MPRVCILTDSTAQFTQADFPGHDRVHILPFGLQPSVLGGDDSLRGGASACWLGAPSIQDFVGAYARLGQEYDSILVLVLSSLLNPTMKNALAATMQYREHVTIEVVDSQTTAVGLGMLVQEAAAAASAGVALKDIVWKVRESIPHIYMLLCIPDLRTLVQSGYLDYSQALAGEIMELMPVFTLEDGELVPTEKVRTPRHLFELFQEFLGEFETPEHIALVHGKYQAAIRTRPLRQHIRAAFPGTPFSEHSINPPLTALFGLRSTVLVIMDRSN